MEVYKDRPKRSIGILRSRKELPLITGGMRALTERRNFEGIIKTHSPWIGVGARFVWSFQPFKHTITAGTGNNFQRLYRVRRAWRHSEENKQLKKTFWETPIQLRLSKPTNRCTVGWHALIQT